MGYFIYFHDDNNSSYICYKISIEFIWILRKPGIIADGPNNNPFWGVGFGCFCEEGFKMEWGKYNCVLEIELFADFIGFAK